MRPVAPLPVTAPHAKLPTLPVHPLAHGDARGSTAGARPADRHCRCATRLFIRARLAPAVESRRPAGAARAGSASGPGCGPSWLRSGPARGTRRGGGRLDHTARRRPFPSPQDAAGRTGGAGGGRAAPMPIYYTAAIWEATEGQTCSAGRAPAVECRRVPPSPPTEMAAAAGPNGGPEPRGGPLPRRSAEKRPGSMHSPPPAGPAGDGPQQLRCTPWRRRRPLVTLATIKRRDAAGGVVVGACLWGWRGGNARTIYGSRRLRRAGGGGLPHRRAQAAQARGRKEPETAGRAVHEV